MRMYLINLTFKTQMKRQILLIALIALFLPVLAQPAAAATRAELAETIREKESVYSTSWVDMSHEERLKARAELKSLHSAIRDAMMAEAGNYFEYFEKDEENNMNTTYYITDRGNKIIDRRPARAIYADRLGQRLSRKKYLKYEARMRLRNHNMPNRTYNRVTGKQGSLYE